MIRVVPAPEPARFDEEVRTPGTTALLELVGDPAAPTRRGPKRNKLADRVEDIPVERLPTFWRKAIPWLREAHADVCGYLGMKIHRSTGAATVDHFKPTSRHPHLAYEWTNFRLASRQVNTNKGDHEDVLDPFAIDDGWFVLHVGTFEVHPSSSLAPALRAKVQATIDRLQLNAPTFCADREEYHDRYHGIAQPVPGREKGPLPLWWLEEECPYVAHELRRQGRLRAGDA